MDSIIKEYLLKYKKVLINGLGYFEVIYKSAEIHPILHSFDPPGNYVSFSMNEKEFSDEFTKYLADKNKIEFSQAEKSIKEWVNQLKEVMKNHKTYTLGSLGSFSFDAVGKMVFVPSLDADISPESYGLESFIFPPSGITQKEESNEIATPKKYRVNQKKSRVQVFLSVILILVLLGVIITGIYAVVYPKQFIDKKEEVFMQISQWFTSDIIYDSVVVTDESEFVIHPKEESYFEKTTTYICDTIYTSHISEIDVDTQAEVEIESSVSLSGNEYIVLGSFQNQENAMAFLEKIKNQYPDAIELGKGKTSGLWMIGIGPYDHSYAQQLLKEKNINGWILKK
ncbi:MAG: SPOR domain-containing protein [Bacteroidales bacterium]|nr:SPOR domain-containing protein [Bacteroidales bacterium]